MIIYIYIKIVYLFIVYKNNRTTKSQQKISPFIGPFNLIMCHHVPRCNLPIFNKMICTSYSSRQHKKLINATSNQVVRTYIYISAKYIKSFLL